MERGRRFEIAELVARREPVELVDIELPALERDGVPRDGDPAAAERRAQRRERPAQRRARAIGRVVGPQELRERVAIVDAALDGEIREQRRRLARVHRERDAVGKHDRWPEELETQRHGTSLIRTVVTP